MSALTAPTITGYSAFWSNILSPKNGAAAGYEMSQERARPIAAYRFAKMMNKSGLRAQKALIANLLGNAAGDTVSATYARVAGSTDTASHLPADVVTLGGARTIETVTDVNRATTAADVTELKRWFSNALLSRNITQPTVYGADMNANKQVGGTGRF